MSVRSVFALCLLAAASVAAAPAPAPGPASCTTIASLAAATPDLSILYEAVAYAGLVDTFNNPTSAITLFAPTNAAITSALTSLNMTATELLANPELVPLLAGHVVQGAVNSSMLYSGLSVPTLLPGENLTFVFVNAPTPAPAPAPAASLGRKAAPSPSVMPTIEVTTTNSTATVITPNLVACAAIVHVVNGVLLPSQSVLNAALGGSQVASF